jgi:hypothetical protein
MRRSRLIELLAAAALFCCLATAASAGTTAGAAEQGRPAARTITSMPDLIRLAKTDPKARAYLYQYLLDHDLYLPTRQNPDEKDPEKIRMVVGDDGNALLFTSERALFNAGETLRWQRVEDGFPYVTMKGQDAFLALFSNGVKKAVLNWKDGASLDLSALEIEELSDGRIPDTGPESASETPAD